jgi:Asp-tRNA(Asn)/Glu-tRNA(Gln) amidotransferase A subunit family amidase
MSLPGRGRARDVGLYTQPLSFIGLPVVSVPVAGGGLLPVGVQLVAAPWQEAGLFRVAAALERDGIIAARIVP